MTFDYSNNNGRYVFGAGDMIFETAWCRGSNTSIHAYTDPPSIRSVALAQGVKRIEDVTNSDEYDTSSSARSPMLGEIVIWQNTSGYYLATKVEALNAWSHGSLKDEITLSYAIALNKSPSFATR